MQSEFHQKMVKAFYTAGHLFDVLCVFGPLDESIAVSIQFFLFWKKPKSIDTPKF